MDSRPSRRRLSHRARHVVRVEIPSRRWARKHVRGPNRRLLASIEAGLAPELVVYSYGTNARLARRLWSSAQRLGHALYLDGLGRSWTGFADKLAASHAFVRRLSDEQVVAVVDAHDLVLVAPPDRLLAAFRSYGAELVIGAERTAWPDRELAERHFPERPDGPGRFVNGGMYVDRARAVRRFLDWAEGFDYRCPDADGGRHDRADDQRALTTFYLQNPGLCALDVAQRVCANLYRFDADDFRLHAHDRVEHRVTGTEPCALHGHGPGRALWKQLARKLEPDS